jgi:hypothetical protein
MLTLSQVGFAALPKHARTLPAQRTNQRPYVASWRAAAKAACASTSRTRRSYTSPSSCSVDGAPGFSAVVIPGPAGPKPGCEKSGTEQLPSGATAGAPRGGRAVEYAYVGGTTGGGARGAAVAGGGTSAAAATQSTATAAKAAAAAGGRIMGEAAAGYGGGMVAATGVRGGALAAAGCMNATGRAAATDAS